MKHVTFSSRMCRDVALAIAVAAVAVVGAAAGGAFGSAGTRNRRPCSRRSAVGGCSLGSGIRGYRRDRRQIAEIDCRGAARHVAVVDVPVGGCAGQGRDDRARLRLAGDLDHLHRQDDRAVAGPAQASRRARQDRRSAVAGRSAVRARRQGRRAAVAAGGRDARGAVVGGNFQRRRHQGAGGFEFAEIVRAEARRIRLGMGLLATIGATSPFVGLFGTVWGIMNSFIGISKSQTTNLAVVAPGIAEALLATALGLVAAIPAVIIYNHFARVDQRLPRTGRPGVGRLGAAVVARSRPHPCRRRTFARGGVGDGCLDRRYRPRRRQRFRRNARDQRHAVHRRHPGSPDHLHGGGAAVDRRPADRLAIVDRHAAEEAGQADLCQHQARLGGGDRRDHGEAGRSGPLARYDGRCQQGSFHLPARRPRGALWRADGRAGNAARRRLFEDQAGGAGGRSRRRAIPPAAPDNPKP